MDRSEFIAERAAIMEFDAGLPRAEAERRAALEWSKLIERARDRFFRLRSIGQTVQSNSPRESAASGRGGSYAVTVPTATTAKPPAATGLSSTER